MGLRHDCVGELWIRVTTESGGAATQLGTGYLLSSKVLITARHVLHGQSTQRQFVRGKVRLLDGSDDDKRYRGVHVVLWASSTFDVALLAFGQNSSHLPPPTGKRIGGWKGLLTGHRRAIRYLGSTTA